MIIRKRAECWIVENNKVWVGVQKGRIMLPGGTLEDDETTQQTAIRETKEEVGIVPTNLKLICKNLIARDNWNGWTHAQTFSYRADFGGIDESLLGNGPEGKFNRVNMSLDKLKSYFEAMLNKDDHMKEVAEQNIWIINQFINGDIKCQ